MSLKKVAKSKNLYMAYVLTEPKLWKNIKGFFERKFLFRERLGKYIVDSETRLGNLLDFGQLFTAFGDN